MLLSVLFGKRYLICGLLFYRQEQSRMGMRELNEAILEWFDSEEASSAPRQGEQTYYNILRPTYGCSYSHKYRTEELPGMHTLVSWSIKVR